MATMATRYRDRMLWIADLTPQRDPNLIDLCGSHADSMTAPYGWELLDDRRPIEIPELLPERLPDLLPGQTARSA
jgi:hypothetical protein